MAGEAQGRLGQGEAGVPDSMPYARQAEQMRLLVELGQRLSAILDLEPLLEAIVVEVRAAFRCAVAALGLLQGKELRVTLATASGLSLPLDEIVMPVDTGICGWVARHQQPLLVPDVTVDPRYWSTASLAALGIRSEVAVPIRLGGQLLGVLDLESDREAAFDALDVPLLETVANQAAVAIGNARAYAEVGRQAAQLRALLATTQEVNSTLDLRRVLEAIVCQVQALIDVDSLFIALLNPETGMLTPVIARHQWGDQVMALALKPGEGITGQVALTGVGEIVERADLDPRAAIIPGTPVEPEALLAAPLRCQGRVLGVMTLSRLGERCFSPADLELVESFASQAAIAVENARLYTASQRYARQVEQAHARLLEAQNQLVQAEKLSAVGQLAAGMAHELNNPLTAIVGFAQLLEAESLSPSGRADLQRILAAASRAHEIVSNLLAFAHQQRISPQAVDLAALVEHTLRLHGRDEALAGSAEAARQTGRVCIVRELAAGLPPVQVDPLQIEQLVVHLLRNAYRATREAGGGHVTVALSQAGEGWVRLVVADEGAPIPGDALPHVFDPFFAQGEVGEGWGLGLSACFGIVHAHRGRIWAEPGPAGGNCFVVELPMGAEAAPGATVAERAVLAVTPDDELAAELVAAAEAMGLRAIRVESGEAALAEIVVHPYDLVLVDVALPGMSLERLYSSASASDPGLSGRFIAIGAGGAVPKGVALVARPLEVKALQAAIVACLGGTSLS